MELLQQVPQLAGSFQPKVEVRFKMHQLPGTSGIRPFLRHSVAEFFDNSPDVIGYVALLFQILSVPFHWHHFALHRHGARQCYGVPFLALSA